MILTALGWLAALAGMGALWIGAFEVACAFGMLGAALTVAGS